MRSSFIPCAGHIPGHPETDFSSNSHNSHEKWEWRSSKETLLREVHSLVSKLAEQIQNLFFFFSLSAAEVLLLGLVVNIFAAEK